jgi:uncharacterized protein
MSTPIPVPNEVTQPFWDAANEGRLVIQRCQACLRRQHPPHVFCLSCGGEVDFQPVSGRGRVHAYSFVHEPRNQAFADVAPYTLAVIELEEQPGLIMLSNLPGVPQDQIRPGLAVEVAFERLTPQIALPQFRPSSSVES